MKLPGKEFVDRFTVAELALLHGVMVRGRRSENEETAARARCVQRFLYENCTGEVDTEDPVFVDTFRLLAGWGHLTHERVDEILKG